MKGCFFCFVSFGGLLHGVFLLVKGRVAGLFWWFERSSAVRLEGLVVMKKGSLLEREVVDVSGWICVDICAEAHFVSYHADKHLNDFGSVLQIMWETERLK